MLLLLPVKYALSLIGVTAQGERIYGDCYACCNDPDQ